MYDPDFDWDELDEVVNRSEALASNTNCSDAESTVEEHVSGDVLGVQEGSQESVGMTAESVMAWKAHGGQVNCISFDVFGSSSSQHCHLYTGCWDDAVLRCWRIPMAYSGDDASHVRAPSRPVGEMKVNGFINAFAQLSPRALLVAASVGLIPTPGESLQTHDVSTIFPREEGPKESSVVPSPTELGDHCHAAGATSQAVETLQASRAIQVAPGRRSDTLGLSATSAAQPQKIFLHTRGCRAISTWPEISNQDGKPHLVASISKDTLGASRVAADASGLQQPPMWNVRDPHSKAEVGAVFLQSAEQLWSGGNDGSVKLWDLGSGSHTASNSCIVSPHAWLRHLDYCTATGLLLASHSDGLSCIDARSRGVAFCLSGQGQAFATHAFAPTRGMPSLLACMGRRLSHYDLRHLPPNAGGLPMLGTCSFQADALALCCRKLGSSRDVGGFCAGVGCKDGTVSFVTGTA